MKQRILFSLSFILIVGCSLALLAVGVLAQDQDLLELKRKAVVEQELAQARAEMLKEEVAVKIGFETKVVKGAPYSAMAEAETSQTLADGNRIRNKTTTLVYRDSEGRTRREVLGKEHSVPTEVFISDPATGVNYSLDTQRRVAVKSQVNLQELELDKMKLLYDLEMKSKKKRKPSAESLGQQVIEGVPCEGRRATLTIPAEEVGNEQPINIVNEQWYSPELQVYVLTKQNDPRTGETIYRLTNINRGEPDRTLFEVPADYNIIDRSAPSAKKKRRPEEEK